MEEISEKSSRPPKKALEAGCPILAVPLFLRQGWKTTKASPVLAIAPRQNVAKSVAKARKSPQCTTRNPNLINNIGGIFRKKHPTPPFFRKNRVQGAPWLMPREVEAAILFLPGLFQSRLQK